MSTTSNKIEKEIKQDLAAMETALNGLTYAQLKDLLKEKREKEIDKVTKELTAAKGIVAALEAQLVNLGATPSVAPVKRGRKAGSRNKATVAKPSKAIKKGKAKRGKVGAGILGFLATKGKAGAHVKEIAAATGNKPNNVTAYFYSGAGKKAAKALGGATFALK